MFYVVKIQNETINTTNINTVSSNFMCVNVFIEPCPNLPSSKPSISCSFNPTPGWANPYFMMLNQVC